MMDLSYGSESDVKSKISSSSRIEQRKNLPDELQRLAQDLEDLTIYSKNEDSQRSELLVEAEILRYTKDYVGEDRDELLKRINELTYQLNRPGNLIEKSKEKFNFGRRMAHQDPYDDTRYPMDSEQYTDPHAQFKRQPYQNQYAEPPPMMHREEMEGRGFYHQRYATSQVQEYADPLRSHVSRRGPFQVLASYQQPQAHIYVSEQYMDHGVVYMDHMEPYPSNGSRHHPSCSCYQCHNKRQVSENYSDVPANTMFNYHTPQSQTRWSVDVNSETNGGIHRGPPRMHLPSGGKHCRPFAGGAPFFTCYKCSELLMLPKKVRTMNNNRRKMKCGACSTVIVLAVPDENLALSIDIEAKDTLVKIDNEHDLPPAHGTNRDSIQGKTTFSSDDYDNSGSNMSTATKDRHSMSIHTSEAEQDKEKMMIAAMMDPYSSETASIYKKPRPPSVSSLQDHFIYSDKFRVANNSKEENRTERSEREKELLKKTTTPEMLRKESSATEIDLSSYEYSNNTGTTYDTGGASTQGHNLKGSREFNGSNRSVDQEKANVTVNGHLITHRLVKKAQRLAGPVYPGNYWYDFRAGFWGSVGGPCLGIIPPFIEQFNYPMLGNCSGGDTSVFVNGRELGEKDMNLLARRGLPTERDRSYIVEISGRILDEDTGEELTSLGKLAPTMEKVKRGFGMRDPKAIFSPKLAEAE